MSAPDFGFLANDDLPSRDTIVTLCEAAGYNCSGIPICNQPSGPIIAWVKYGPTVTMAEALTQDYVARFLIANSTTDVRVPRVYAAFSRDTSNSAIGYIVMQYIDAPGCGEGDHQLVARAVQTLIGVEGPSSAPGPVGGGPVIHSFFLDGESPITYETVDELQQHINGVSEHQFFRTPR
jgi:hypothetical protein